MVEQRFENFPFIILVFVFLIIGKTFRRGFGLAGGLQGLLGFSFPLDNITIKT